MLQYFCVFFGVTATVVVGVTVVAVVAILAFALLYAYKLRIRWMQTFVATNEIFSYEFYTRHFVFVFVHPFVSYCVISTTADNDNQLTISWTVNSFSTDLWLLCLAAVELMVSVRCQCWFNLNQRLLQWLTTTLLTTSIVRLTSLRPAKHHHLLIICLVCL